MVACVVVLEQMDLWAQRKPTLSQRLREVETEIDETVLAAFPCLTQEERRYIRERAIQFPLNQVLVRDELGLPTKQIAIKYWQTGERYRV